MLKNMLITSSFILLGSLVTFGQDQTFEDKWKSEPSFIESKQQDFDIARDLQNDNDSRQQERDNAPSVADTVRDVIESSINERDRGSNKP